MSTVCVSELGVPTVSSLPLSLSPDTRPQATAQTAAAAVTSTTLHTLTLHSSTDRPTVSDTHYIQFHNFYIVPILTKWQATKEL